MLEFKKREELMMRKAEVARETLETKIKLNLELEGSGKGQINTGIGFLDHMLDSFSRFARVNLELTAEGDLEVDQHHTIEDCGIVLGQALKEALGDKKGIERAGDCLLPMDEALVQIALDISNRGYLVWEVDCPGEMIGDFPVEMAEEFFRAFVLNSGITLHVYSLQGKNRHHIMEAVFKAVGKALGEAIKVNSDYQDIPSTKGTL